MKAHSRAGRTAVVVTSSVLCLTAAAAESMPFQGVSPGSAWRQWIQAQPRRLQEDELQIGVAPARRLAENSTTPNATLAPTPPSTTRAPDAYARVCPVPTWRPDQVSSTPPSCTPCAALEAPPGLGCFYDVSECEAVKPGTSCRVQCNKPFTGNYTIATCAVGNSNAAQRLNWTEPECECPEPSAQQGYVKVGTGRRRRMDYEGGPAPGEWSCASGYGGVPSAMCQGANGCSNPTDEVTSWLEGCLPLMPCAAPIVDKCRYDVSACTSVQPGETCEVRCKPPLLGGYTIATCNATNTDPDEMVRYYPLPCRLEECPDPEPWPLGYTKTTEGAWTCAGPTSMSLLGYNGQAINRCAPGASWTLDCGATAVLDGCEEVVQCGAPEMTGLDACMYDTTACLNVDPGSTCEVHCKVPFVGISTEASCPNGNVNRRGLIWTAPKCVLLECEDPGVIPAGYTKTSQGWQCAQSYSGYAVKLCEAALSCEVAPRLDGCAQLMPCVAPPADCRYDVYGCISVQPGQNCHIRCKAPFSGGVIVASCVAGNTNASGLVVPEWPVCAVDTCPDPYPWPMGYAKSTMGWQCAVGYAGLVTKECMWTEATCGFEAYLSGCSLEVPCAPLSFTKEADICKYNISDCDHVLSGGTCQVGCLSPYFGPPSTAQCDDSNVNASTPLEWTPPDCTCRDPSPPKPGFNLTTEGWRCSSGYAGTAQKICRPAANCRNEPFLVGCVVPLVCQVEAWVDQGSTSSSIIGKIYFGAALIDGVIDESEVTSYRVYLADACHLPVLDDDLDVKAPVATIDVSPSSKSCCDSFEYTASLNVEKPEGAIGLVIMVYTFRGEAVTGRFLEFTMQVDVPGNRMIVTSLATRATAPVCAGVAVAAAATLALLLLRGGPLSR